MMKLNTYLGSTLRGDLKLGQYGDWANSQKSITEMRVLLRIEQDLINHLRREDSKSSNSEKYVAHFGSVRWVTYQAGPELG